ncbi:hypothetical protein C7B71_17240 [Bacillus halotolerans]|nr:hypothetical protein C7B71_17240 [Bacillus halotolerans]
MTDASVDEHFFATNLSQGGFHRREYSSSSRIAEELLYEAGFKGVTPFFSAYAIGGWFAGKAD